MKLKLIAVICLIGSVYSAQAQNKSALDSLFKLHARLFNGTKQYRTWSVGVNAGVLAPVLVIGGVNNFSNVNPQLGYGISVRKQLGSVLGLQADVIRGYISGSNQDKPGGSEGNIEAFTTELGYSASLSAVFKVGSVNYFSHKNAVNFFVSLGSGFAGYAPKVFWNNGTYTDTKNMNGKNKDKTYIHEIVTIAGVGVKFKVNDRLAINAAYNANFVDNDFLDGTHSYDVNKYNTHKDKFSYGYAGLEYTLGKKSKQNIDWLNPLAELYEELLDPTMHQEFNDMKARNVIIERIVMSIEKDSDADGVADYFDKCPNTPTGTAVDGSGCPIKLVKNDTTIVNNISLADKVNQLEKALIDDNIRFDFDSEVLRLSSYPYLNALAKDLKANPAKVITVKGYASSEGSPSHNIRIAINRAKAVKTYLLSLGVLDSQVKIKGYGETKSVSNNSTEEGRMMNRRVVIE